MQQGNIVATRLSLMYYVCGKKKEIILRKLDNCVLETRENTSSRSIEGSLSTSKPVSCYISLNNKPSFA